MNIQSCFKTYSVFFTDSLASLETFSRTKEIFFVIDRKVYELYKEKLLSISSDRLFLIDAVEEHKDMDTVLKICSMMTSMPSKRNTHLVSIGGGIVQDITGLVANILYRGIRWTFFPSTLLAASDSCIGGKSSLNYKGFKNLLGSFYPPDEIIIYLPFIKTLSEGDYLSGLGEVVKFNVIAGNDGVSRIEHDIDALTSRDYTILEKYVETSLQFKKGFIEEDEFDCGRRILLNFAHTFGHAYEVTSHYAVPHGSAVALGMLTANNISVRRRLLTYDYAARIEAICSKILHFAPQKEWFDLDNVITAISKDKKQTGTSISAVLLNGNGSLEVVKDVQAEEISFALRRVEQVFSA